MERSKFLVVVCRSSQDWVEQAEKILNDKLPFSQGPNKPKMYANEESWGMVLSTVENEMDLRETQAVNTYKAKADVAEKVRVALNEKAQKEDHFTVQTLALDTGLSDRLWS